VDFIQRVSQWILFREYLSGFYLEGISVDGIYRVSEWIVLRGYLSRFYLEGISVDFKTRNNILWEIVIGILGQRNKTLCI
jgi:hypothetical protein